MEIEPARGAEDREKSRRPQLKRAPAALQDVTGL
jgi:hypothetical protein